MDLSFLIVVAALILSIVIHEVSHGFMANWLGDPTARLAGRLTLNPISHIDPIGSIAVPAFLVLTNAGLLFGWAKPVPYNPYNLKNQRWGEALVAFAGPGVNLIIAFVFAILIRVGVASGFAPAFIDLASYIVYINILLAFFNLIPIPPLDGSKVLAGILPWNLQMRYRELGARIEQYGIFATFAFIFIFMYVLWAPFHALISGFFEILVGFRF
jgi:Zn-dependent protease